MLQQLTTMTTDAKRLQGQDLSAWVIAILRGCLLVPIFEEVLFRGLLLSWLNRHMRFTFALLIQAVLFAAMHVYPFAHLGVLNAASQAWYLLLGSPAWSFVDGF